MQYPLSELFITFWKLCDCLTLLRPVAKTDQSLVPFLKYTEQIYSNFLALIQRKTEPHLEDNLFSTEVTLDEHETSLYQSITPLFTQFKQSTTIGGILKAHFQFRNACFELLKNEYEFTHACQVLDIKTIESIVQDWKDFQRQENQLVDEDIATLEDKLAIVRQYHAIQNRLSMNVAKGLQCGLDALELFRWLNQQLSSLAFNSYLLSLADLALQYEDLNQLFARIMQDFGDEDEDYHTIKDKILPQLAKPMQRIPRYALTLAEALSENVTTKIAAYYQIQDNGFAQQFAELKDKLNLHLRHFRDAAAQLNETKRQQEFLSKKEKLKKTAKKSGKRMQHQLKHSASMGFLSSVWHASTTTLSPQEAQFLDAARQGNIPLAQAALEGTLGQNGTAKLDDLPQQSIRINCKEVRREHWNFIGYTALSYAAHFGHLEFVNWLLAYSSEQDPLNTQVRTRYYNQDYTCAHLAARHGHIDIVRRLLKADPELALIEDDKNGDLPLFVALSAVLPPPQEKCIPNTAPHVTDSSESTLDTAGRINPSVQSTSQIAAALDSQGSEQALSEQEPDTAEVRLKLARLLCQHRLRSQKAKPREESTHAEQAPPPEHDTPFEPATPPEQAILSTTMEPLEKRAALVNELLSAEPLTQLLHRNRSNQHAIERVLNCGEPACLAIVQHHIEQCGDRELAALAFETAREYYSKRENQQKNRRGLQLVELSELEQQLLSGAREANVESVQSALAQGVDPDVQDVGGSCEFYTALHHATRNSSMDTDWEKHQRQVRIVQLLLSHQANHRLQTYFCQGNTPLHWAARHGNGEMVGLLLDVTNPPLAVKEHQHGFTPLHYAVDQDQIEVVRLFLERRHHRQLLATSNDGVTTAFRLAVNQKKWLLAQLILLQVLKQKLYDTAQREIRYYYVWQYLEKLSRREDLASKDFHALFETWKQVKIDELMIFADLMGLCSKDQESTNNTALLSILQGNKPIVIDDGGELYHRWAGRCRHKQARQSKRALSQASRDTEYSLAGHVVAEIRFGTQTQADGSKKTWLEVKANPHYNFFLNLPFIQGMVTALKREATPSETQPHESDFLKDSHGDAVTYAMCQLVLENLEEKTRQLSPAIEHVAALQ